ncbi:MAG TPA: late competence development ComFB family protein [Spirochaetota bacterium]
MAIKNIMEDVVLSTIEEILKEDKFFSGAERYKQDISAYVLNRVPPKYVTSERGILHGKLESRFLFQQKTDIILLIHEALEVIRNRRDKPTPSLSDSLASRELFFPHIIGEVLEETTFSIVPDVEVTLLFKGKTVSMVDTSWENPYTTHKGTLGYYHFWPDVDPSSMNIGNEVPMTIQFSHTFFKKKEMEVLIPVLSVFDVSHSRAVPIALLQLKDGVDTTFLYE